MMLDAWLSQAGAIDAAQLAIAATKRLQALFFGLFAITICAYFILGFVLDVKPADAEEGATRPNAGELLDRLESALRRDEYSVREIERYVTSETFSVRSRFRQL